MLNSLYGKFATSLEVQSKVPILRWWWNYTL
jgi:hypothetical protein